MLREVSSNILDHPLRRPRVLHVTGPFSMTVLTRRHQVVHLGGCDEMEWFFIMLVDLLKSRSPRCFWEKENGRQPVPFSGQAATSRCMNRATPARRFTESKSPMFLSSWSVLD